eukprot:CAMPEP_0178415780 /NCGR_PEP_ID=MMETSP0689_2-20121128/23727_1 /TAXON_ID=160604 /ORGANISM="Amphidinium massartii, Strain CS-259" /LENGTH=31 /DNA_ID= /DNA_START= /DNA_END= /DNA_ORIENTATION=
MTVSTSQLSADFPELHLWTELVSPLPASAWK